MKPNGVVCGVVCKQVLCELLHFKCTRNLEKIKDWWAELMNILEEVRFEFIFGRRIKFELEKR